MLYSFEGLRPAALPRGCRVQGTARNLRNRKHSVCCPETADLHLGKEVDQQPSATKQTHPPLNLEANRTDTIANQLPAGFADGRVRPANADIQGTYSNMHCFYVYIRLSLCLLLHPRLDRNRIYYRPRGREWGLTLPLKWISDF